MSVWRRAKLGGDAFLGEVVIPLREVEAVARSAAGADLRRYTLGRRSARDKAGGFLCHMFLLLKCKARFHSSHSLHWPE